LGFPCDSKGNLSSTGVEIERAVRKNARKKEKKNKGEGGREKKRLFEEESSLRPIGN